MSELKHDERYGAYMTANNAPVPFVASASQSNWGAFRAFSESLDDDLSFTGLGAGTEQWVQIQLDAPIRIWAFRICCRTTVSAKDSGQVPKNFVVQGSEDGEIFEDIQVYADVAWDQFTTWDAANNKYDWADAKKIEINGQKEYQYYRFLMGECQSISTQKAGSMTPSASNTVKLTLIDLYQVEGWPDPPKTIEIVDSTCVEATAATTLTASVSASPGDIILATITVRSALSLPDDWKLLFTSDYVIDTGDPQSISFATKTAENNTESITVTQTEAKRIYINLITVRGAKGIAYYPEMTSYIRDNPNTAGYQVPDKKQGEKIIWGCSAYMWSSSAPYGNWETTPDDLQMFSLDQSKTAPRQANFVDMGDGAASRTFVATPKTTGSICIIAAVRLVEYDTRYLLESQGTYYSIINNTLVTVEIAELTAQAFQLHGFDQKPKSDLLKQLDNPKILYWQHSQDPLPERTVAVQAIPKTQTLYTTEQDLADPSIVGIDNIRADASANVLFAFSSDRGSFRVYNTETGAWVDAEEYGGMSKAEVEAITAEQWSLLMGREVYQIRFLLAENSYLNKITVVYKNEGGIVTS